MKIAMLTSDYLPSIGGIASHIYELSKALRDAGHEVEIWYWNRKGLQTDANQGGDIPVRHFSMQGSSKKGRKLTSFLAAEIHGCLQEFDAQVLHVHTLDHLMGAIGQVRKTYKGVTVWTNHTSRFLRKVGSFWWRLKLRVNSRGFDGLLAPSEELLEKARFLGIKKDHCRYIANGVDVNKFAVIDRSEARKKLNIAENKFVLLSTRRFSPKNGIRFLAEAMTEVNRIVPEVLCVFCGNMPEAKDWPAVEQIVKKNELEPFVRFEGAVPNTAINTYLSAADVVVLPSLMEATSISGLEAMSASRPLVGTKVGGIPELIEEGKNGFLVDPSDSHALGEGIIKMYQSPNRDQMGQFARDKVIRKYSWEMVADKVIGFYQDCGVGQA